MSDKPPPPPQPKPEQAQRAESELFSALFAGLKGTTAKRLTSSVENVDGLSPEEAAALDRGGEHALRGIKRRVFRWAYMAGFWIALTIVIVLTASFLVMLFLYIQQINTEGKIEGVIASIVTFIFGMLATLAVEFFIRKKEK